MEEHVVVEVGPAMSSKGIHPQRAALAGAYHLMVWFGAGQERRYAWKAPLSLLRGWLPWSGIPKANGLSCMVLPGLRIPRPGQVGLRNKLHLPQPHDKSKAVLPF